MKYKFRHWKKRRTRVLCFVFLFVICVYIHVQGDSVSTSVWRATPLVASGWTTPDNIGSPVNTAGWESCPSISPDGNYLYFTYANFDYLTYTISGKRNKTGPDLGPNPNDLGDIMVSYKTNNSYWNKPAPFGNINETLALNDGLFTQDNLTYYFSGLRKKNLGGAVKSDIYFSVIKHGKLSPPVNLGAPVNTGYNESNPWLSPDGKTLLFDSDRPGGHGGYDIWMSTYNNGHWQTPVNLGALINSGKNEQQPFMTRKGEVLYFAGDSRLGDNDHVIYVSYKQKNNWSEPQVIVSNMVERPTLTQDGSRMYFMHIYKLNNGSYNADILVTLRN